MLYFGCQLDPVRLTKHLRGTCKSEQKKEKKLEKSAFLLRGYW